MHNIVQSFASNFLESCGVSFLLTKPILSIKTRPPWWKKQNKTKHQNLLNPKTTTKLKQNVSSC